ncbi:MAG: 4'-phosphopantetheinyl transferase superfamily protein [Patulibacter minatonensis]
MASPVPQELDVPGDGQVAVWWSRIDVEPAALVRASGAVDAATLARAQRMRRERDGRQVLLAHALLRRLLAGLTGRRAPTIELLRRCASCDGTDHGRPYLPGGASFGLSHGGELVVVALAAPGADVAVDVEAVQPPERWEAVRRHAFSDDEWAATGGDPAGDRTAHWCRKEAVVKATGYGLEIDLTRVHLDPTVPPATEQPSAVRFDAGDPAAPAGDWCVADLDLAPAHRVAVALRTPRAPLRFTRHHAEL